MKGPKRSRVFRVFVLVVAGLTAMTPAPVGWAASHREAPAIALDPAADLTDVYAFRSWENPSKAVFIMNVIPAQAPASGPNYFNFDDNVLYQFHFDLDADGEPGDLAVEFRFRTELRPPFDDLPVSFAGVGGVPGLPPPITALDGSGSEGLGLRQLYAVSGRAGSSLGRALEEAMGTKEASIAGRPLVAVPSNIGPRTMPDYHALAEQGVFEIGSGIRVFAGQREETFYIDLGSTFDTLNFRRNPPVLNNPEDASDTTNPFGVDDGFEGLNVNTIAIEIPLELLPPVIGMYASTSRPASTVKGRAAAKKDGDEETQDHLVQVARLGNPLVNEVIIGTGQKDRWNATRARDEEQFLGFYLTPRLAALLNLAFGIPVPPTPRQDLVNVLLQYPTGGILSDLLRLNLTVPPTPPANQKRLGPLAHDAAGNPTPDPAAWPNGRRPNDDVTDIAVRVVAGVIAGDPCCTGFPHNRLGDGVNFNRVRPGTPNVSPGNNISTRFPFLPIPNPGRSASPNEPLFR